jgi:uncharacterized protein involved in exopolysaccharide biosynthesis
MRDVFDVYQYVDYLRRRWRFIAAACGTAVLLGALFTLQQTRQYTALTSIMIDPPGGVDPRSAMVVSPVYLESLRTYELLAGSNNLLQRALERFSLRQQKPGLSIEDWKARILKVEVPRSTKILEIRVTLPDPKTAHGVALFIAEEVVKLNRGLTEANDIELSAGTERQLSEARLLRDKVQGELQSLLKREPVSSLEAEIETLQDRLTRLDRELTDAEQAVAEYTDRLSQPGAENKVWHPMLSVERAKVTHLKSQRKAVTDEIAGKSAGAADRSARVEQMQLKLKTAQAALQTLETRLQESRSMAGHRAERLRVIDTGVIPERPSSPRMSLNLIATFLAGLILSVLYLSLEFGYQRFRMVAERRLPAMTGRHSDD